MNASKWQFKSFIVLICVSFLEQVQHILLSAIRPHVNLEEEFQLSLWETHIWESLMTCSLSYLVLQHPKFMTGIIFHKRICIILLKLSYHPGQLCMKVYSNSGRVRVLYNSYSFCILWRPVYSELETLQNIRQNSSVTATVYCLIQVSRVLTLGVVTRCQAEFGTYRRWLTVGTFLAQYLIPLGVTTVSYISIMQRLRQRSDAMGMTSQQFVVVNMRKLMLINDVS